MDQQRGKKVKGASHQLPLCLTFGVKSAVVQKRAAASVAAHSEASALHAHCT